MNREETQGMAFQLIGYAGDAFSHFFQAVSEAKAGNYEKAQQCIAEGRKSMVEAHNTQNDLLAGEAPVAVGGDGKLPVWDGGPQGQAAVLDGLGHVRQRLAQEFVDVYRELNELKRGCKGG